MNLGDTFVPAKYDRHLWVVSSDPSQGRVVIFNLTTYTIDEEDVCIFDVGDHPFIKHRTAVRYAGAKCVSVAQLEKLIQSGSLTPNHRASEQMLQKIWLGASLSVHIELGVLEFLEDQNLLPD